MLLTKKERTDSFKKYINDNFGNHTWTTLFTYEINCDYNCGTILLYFNLTSQNIQNKSICPTLDTLRINQHIYLDIISKTSILIESLIRKYMKQKNRLNTGLTEKNEAFVF